VLKRQNQIASERQTQTESIDQQAGGYTLHNQQLLEPSVIESANQLLASHELPVG
jgi:hypothetical protein